MGTPFGAVTTAAQIEQAIISTLQLHLPHYVAEVERQSTAPGTTPALPAPRAYRVWTDTETWPHDQLPAVIVACPGTVGDPKRTPSGHCATWEVQVGVIVRAPEQARVRRNAAVYAAAARAVAVQRPSMGGRAAATTWVGEEITTEPDTGQTWGLGIVRLHVEVAGMVDPGQGPLWPDTPPADPALPWIDWADIESAGIAVGHKEDE